MQADINFRQNKKYFFTHNFECLVSTAFEDSAVTSQSEAELSKARQKNPKENNLVRPQPQAQK
jgi:hypothetical protein